MKRLEAIARVTMRRGPHAFGFAWIDSRGRLKMFKKTGRIVDHLSLLAMAQDAQFLIGHCRYATHGDPGKQPQQSPASRRWRLDRPQRRDPRSRGDHQGRRPARSGDGLRQRSPRPVDRGRGRDVAAALCRGDPVRQRQPAGDARPLEPAGPDVCPAIGKPPASGHLQGPGLPGVAQGPACRARSWKCRTARGSISRPRACGRSSSAATSNAHPMFTRTSCFEASYANW